MMEMYLDNSVSWILSPRIKHLQYVTLPCPVSLSSHQGHVTVVGVLLDRHANIEAANRVRTMFVVDKSDTRLYELLFAVCFSVCTCFTTVRSHWQSKHSQTQSMCINDACVCLYAVNVCSVNVCLLLFRFNCTFELVLFARLQLVSQCICTVRI